MLKLMGIMGLILSFGLYGISKTSRLKERVMLLEDYYEMVIALKGQKNYFKEPLPDIFKKTSKNSHSKAHLFLKALGDDIDKKGCYTRDFWSNNLIYIYKDTPLTTEDIETMSYLGEFIGQTDYDNHLQHFSYMQEKLKKQIDKSKTIFNQKGPMYSKIGFFIGAIAGILLL